MNIKQAKVIKAEKDNIKEMKIFLQDNGYREYTTLYDLLKCIEADRLFAKDQGFEEEFLNMPITMQLSDVEGQSICGKLCCEVGLCGEGSNIKDMEFIITGNIDEVAFVKEDKQC